MGVYERVDGKIIQCGCPNCVFNGIRNSVSQKLELEATPTGCPEVLAERRSVEPTNATLSLPAVNGNLF